MAFVEQNSLNEFLTGVEPGKQIALLRPFKVEIDKMVKISGEPIDDKGFSNLPGSPQNNRLPVCGVLPTQQFRLNFSFEYHVKISRDTICPYFKTYLVIFMAINVTLSRLIVKEKPANPFGDMADFEGFRGSRVPGFEGYMKASGLSQ